MTVSRSALADQLAAAVGLLRRQRRLDGLDDPDELAGLQAALEFLGSKNRTEPKFSPLSAVGPEDAPMLAYRYGEVAEFLRVTPRTVEKLVASGELAVLEIGGARRIPHNALCEWISDRTVRREKANLEARRSAERSGRVRKVL